MGMWFGGELGEVDLFTRPGSQPNDSCLGHNGATTAMMGRNGKANSSEAHEGTHQSSDSVALDRRGQRRGEDGKETLRLRGTKSEAG